MEKIKVSPIHEQIILGTMLRNEVTRKQLTKTLSPSIFYTYRHKQIFTAIQELEERSLSYVPTTLKSFLPPDDSEWGGLQYLDKLESLRSDDNIDFHIERAKWDTIRNSLLAERIPEIQALLLDPKVEPSLVYERLKKVAASSRLENEVKFIHGKNHIARYEATLYAREGGLNTRTTGYLALDKKLTSPCCPGWLTVIAAAPSIGKTTFCLNMGARQSARWKVGYLAWESGPIAATDILCSSQLNIPLYNLIKKPGKLSDTDRERITEFLTTIFDRNNNFSFLPTPPKSIIQQRSQWEVNDAVLDWFDSILEEWDVDIIYWDLFEKRLADRRPQAISWALDRIQDIAQRHNVHIILLHQITLKEAEKQPDKRPTRGNLKGTGSYIEVPDFVFGLYRKAVYERGISDNELELYCLKQRLGPWPFRIVFEWNGKYCQVKGGREQQITVDEDNYDEGI